MLLRKLHRLLVPLSNRPFLLRQDQIVLESVDIVRVQLRGANLAEPADVGEVRSYTISNLVTMTFSRSCENVFAELVVVVFFLDFENGKTVGTKNAEDQNRAEKEHRCRRRFFVSYAKIFGMKNEGTADAAVAPKSEAIFFVGATKI